MCVSQIPVVGVQLSVKTMSRSDVKMAALEKKLQTGQDTDEGEDDTSPQAEANLRILQDMASDKLITKDSDKDLVHKLIQHGIIDPKKERGANQRLPSCESAFASLRFDGIVNQSAKELQDAMKKHGASLEIINMTGGGDIQEAVISG